MAFTVQDFRSKLIKGGARQNLFAVFMTFPSYATPTTGNDQFSFMCKAASLPPEEVGVIPVPYFGRQIKVPGDRTFPEWNITVINDEDFDLRDAFERWSNAINGHFNNRRNAQAFFASGYSVDVTILQYGKRGDVIKEYDMIGMWPSAITPQDLAWDANDQIEEFQVTMQYQWWVSRTSV
jgi:hypothetical protein